VGFLALAGYFLLTPRVSGMGDGPEFTLGLATGGLVHPTGYPLFTMTGYAFVQVLHALGAPWPFGANLWSGVGAATAVGLLYALALRLAQAGEWGSAGGARLEAAAAAFPAVLLAVNPALLAEASVAEVNTWSLAWTCAAGLLFTNVMLRLEATDSDDPTISPGIALGWGLLLGAGLAHHLLSVLVGVPLSIALLFAATRRRALRFAHVAAAVGGALLPLASYAFVAWRAFHPAPAQWPTVAPSLAGVLEHVTGARYRQFLGFFAPAVDQRPLLERGIYPYLFPGIALLLVAGARAVTTERRILWWGLLSAVLSVMLFVFQYGVPDPPPYFLPAAALGLAPLARLVMEVGSIRALPVGARVAVGGIVLAGVASLGVIGVQRALSERVELTRYDREVRAMWAMVPADTVVVFWPADQSVRLQEYQVLEGLNPAAFVSTPDLLLDDIPRARFKERFGIDPLNGVRVPYLPPGSPGALEAQRRFVDRVATSISARTPVPVILFDPSVPLLRTLRKR
jgi:hypothetical protein